jgi:hypothetical protein
LRRDDGAIVYLNDVEVFRSNLPSGPVTYETLANTSSTSETAFFTREVSAAHLAAGSNVVAVEVHQASATSSDMSFELELIGQTTPSLLPRFVRGDANSDGQTDVSDAVNALLFLFAGGRLSCLDAADVNDDGAADITDAIHLLGHLFLGGPPPAPPAGICGEDATDDALTCESYPLCP